MCIVKPLRLTRSHETSIHLDSHLRYFEEIHLVMTICTKQILPSKFQSQTASWIYQRHMRRYISYILRLQLNQSKDCSGSRRRSAKEIFPVKKVKPITRSKDFFVTVIWWTSIAIVCYILYGVSVYLQCESHIYLLFSWTCVLHFWPSHWSWRTPQSCTCWAMPDATVPCMPDPGWTGAYRAGTLRPSYERIKSIKLSHLSS